MSSSCTGAAKSDGGAQPLFLVRTRREGHNRQTDRQTDRDRICHQRRQQLRLRGVRSHQRLHVLPGTATFGAGEMVSHQVGTAAQQHSRGRRGFTTAGGRRRRRRTDMRAQRRRRRGGGGGGRRGFLWGRGGDPTTFAFFCFCSPTPYAGA
eukprot:SAG31_NODE_5066_length_2761_cov_53.694966_3_plen_150_part_01